MLIKLNVKHHKDYNYTITDFVSNKNVEPNLINMRFVREVLPFNERIIEEARPFYEYLYGAKTVLLFDDNNRIFVIDSIEDIQAKLNIV